MVDQGPPKRRKLDDAAKSRVSKPLSSLIRNISPPGRMKRASATPREKHDDPTGASSLGNGQGLSDTAMNNDAKSNLDGEGDNAPIHVSMESEKVALKPKKQSPIRIFSSPIQLTRIQNLPSSHNVDAVSLRDLIGDPMIKECWQFNFLLDLDFIM